MTDGARWVLADAPAVAQAAADRFARACEAAVAARGCFRVALAGGTTPRAMHAALCAARFDRLPWDSIEVYFGDERCVAPDHPDSNFGMAHATLLLPRGIPADRVRRMSGEQADRDRAAREYEGVLPDRLDLIVLGVGADGHTLSLFPGAPALRERTRRVLAVEAPTPPVHRLSLTSPELARARELMMLAVGAGKAAAVARALQGEWAPERTPAQWARHGAWFLDRAAGADWTRGMEQRARGES